MTEKNSQDFTVLIVAAGNASRFGGDVPKQYAKIHGFPVLRHTINAFLKCDGLRNIQVIIQDGHQDLYKDAIKGLNLLPPVIGGESRQDSVKNGLGVLKNHCGTNDILFIHDAARPCITAAEISHLRKVMITARAATLTLPVVETLRREEDSVLGDIVPRDHLLTLQTPQVFHFDDILAAHITHAGKNMTDDTALASAAGITVTSVTGARSNIKITYAEDIMLAEKLLGPTMPIPRTAMGFDVHAFGETATHIRVGGIDIPHTHKLSGHSDADVVLHAITDALYGLVSDGDIGSHFPPSNNTYKGMDSAVFLKDAIDTVRAKGGTITHIDCTVICEAPKIGPHRDAIRTRIADICELKTSQISIKATTTEQLGFTGRREGIAAQAIATGLFHDV